MKDTIQIVGKVFEDASQDTIVRGFKCKTKSGTNYLLHATLETYLASQMEPQ